MARQHIPLQRSELIDAALEEHPKRYTYRVGHLLGELGMPWVDFDFSRRVAPPVLTISHRPKQNQAEDGTTIIKVNPTQLSEQMPLPVQSGHPTFLGNTTG